MVAADDRILLDWDALEVGETFETYQYLLTQDMIDTYRQGVMDPEASFPTISHKVDVKQYNARYRDAGSVNARCAFYCYNPARRRQDDHGARVDRRQVPASGQELHRHRGRFR